MHGMVLAVKHPVAIRVLINAGFLDLGHARTLLARINHVSAAGIETDRPRTTTPERRRHTLGILDGPIGHRC
jgi:hypothetical protein